MFGRKKYSLSTMTFNDLGKMIHRYMGRSRSKIALLHVCDETFIVTTTAEEVSTGLHPKYYVSFSKNYKTDRTDRNDMVADPVFAMTFNNGLVLIDYIVDDSWKSATCGVSGIDLCGCDLTCFNYEHCKFNNIRLLEEYLHELVKDKVDKRNDNVKYAMIFTAMISVLGYCVMKVVKYIRADKTDRRAMLKSTLVPACILAAFTVTTNTFRLILAGMVQVVKMANKMITKLMSVKKG